MYFGFPGLALILVVSVAPKEKIVEGVEDEKFFLIPLTPTRVQTPCLFVSFSSAP